MKFNANLRKNYLKIFLIYLNLNFEKISSV